MIFIASVIKDGANRVAADLDPDQDLGSLGGDFSSRGGITEVRDELDREGRLRMETSSKAMVTRALDSMAIDPHSPTLSERGRSFVVGLVPFIGRAQGIADARAAYATGNPEKMEQARQDAVIEGMLSAFDATLVGGVTVSPVLKGVRYLSTVCEFVPGGKSVAPMRKLAEALLSNDEAKRRVEQVLTADME